MKMKKKKTFRLGLAGLLAGAGLGALAMRLRNSRRNGQARLLGDQRRMSRALDRAYGQARSTARLPLGPGTRYVIFSDHHKGARNGADDFLPCEPAYLAALDYYYGKDTTLIVLGDVEELWEEKIARVMRAYANVFTAEARFYPGRYLRVVGNHDDAWLIEGLVKKHLHPYFPGLAPAKALLFQYPRPGKPAGQVFLAHGHQGTLDADIFPGFARFFLPFYRNIQILTGWGRTTPAKDACLRGLLDTRLYRWAVEQGPLLLIAGHTHRPVWSSQTHLDKLQRELLALEEAPEGQRSVDQDEQAARLVREIAERVEKYPPCNDTFKERPCYFNTGCCRFADGDITGLEIEEAEMRLVKWSVEEGVPTRTIFERVSLDELFDRLDEPG